MVSMTRGRSTLGLGLGHTNRRLFAPQNAPGLVVYGTEDESWYAQVFLCARPEFA
jgi:hypothetical protein